MPFFVLCATCVFTPNSDTGEGSVTCELVHRQAFVTREEADAYAQAIWRSPTSLREAVRQLAVDLQRRKELDHVHRYWLHGKNPYEVTLAEARAYPGSDALAVKDGDEGGQTYIVCPVKLLHCDEDTLKRLLADIDAMEWPGQPELARLSFHRPLSDWWETERVWVHERLKQKELESRIRAVLAVERATTG